MMNEGKLNVDPLVTHQYEFEDTVTAYQTLSEDRTAIGIVLNYPKKEITLANASAVTLDLNDIRPSTEQPVVGIIGAITRIKHCFLQ
jgi:hypothetical protein